METRYFIRSLDDQAPERLAKAIRAHWSVENNLHWVLDVAFDEDRNRTHNGHSAAKLAIIRCQHTACQRSTSLLDYTNQAYRPGMKEQIVDRALNSSGIRDTARILGISPVTVIETLKKSI